MNDDYLKFRIDKLRLDGLNNAEIADQLIAELEIEEELKPKRRVSKGSRFISTITRKIKRE